MVTLDAGALSGAICPQAARSNKSSTGLHVDEILNIAVTCGEEKNVFFLKLLFSFYFFF
jgi:hypothetical protein